MQVYKAKRWEATVVALKMLIAQGPVPASDFVRALELELQVMREAKHPHIVTCFGICVQVWVCVCSCRRIMCKAIIHMRWRHLPERLMTHTTLPLFIGLATALVS